MKHIKIASITVAMAVTVLFSSCKKDDAEPAVNVNASSTLDVGRAGIMFNTSANFVTNNAFSLRNTATTTATYSDAGGMKSFVLYALEVNGTTPVREATIAVSMPSSTTTANGNIVANLATPGTVTADIELGSYTAGNFDSYYGSTSGVLTITKLTASEVEGTFNGTVTDGTTTYTMANGSFAGKFQ